jgi:hypothetical protein
MMDTFRLLFLDHHVQICPPKYCPTRHRRNQYVTTLLFVILAAMDVTFDLPKWFVAWAAVCANIVWIWDI